MLNVMNYLSELQRLKAEGLEDVSVIGRNGKELNFGGKITDFIDSKLVGFNSENECVEVPFVDLPLTVSLLLSQGTKINYSSVKPIEFEEGGYIIGAEIGPRMVLTTINYKDFSESESQFNYWNPVVEDKIYPMGRIITYYDGKSFLIG